MIGRHKMLWRREPYRHHLGPSSDAWDDDRLTRNDHTRVDVVASRDRIDQDSGVPPTRHPLGDRPDGVPGPDDIHLFRGSGRMHTHIRGPGVTAECPGNRGTHDERQGYAQERRGDPSAAANTCSSHGSMMPERLFGVKGPLEHMFASPPAWC